MMMVVVMLALLRPPLKTILVPRYSDTTEVVLILLLGPVKVETPSGRVCT